MAGRRHSGDQILDGVQFDLNGLQRQVGTQNQGLSGIANALKNPIEVEIDGPTEVDTGLPEITGWFVIDKDAAVHVFSTGTRGGILTLEAATPVNIKLLVF